MQSWLFAGIFVLLSFAALGYEAWGDASTQPLPTPAGAATTNPAAGPALNEKVVSASGLGVIVTTKGTPAKKGDTVLVHYVGRLEDGKEFDSSLKRGQPFVFKLGADSVIKGWDEGIAGMEVGERRQLIIPPDLAYGPQGSPGAIPPNATLTFDVELVGLVRQ